MTLLAYDTKTTSISAMRTLLNQHKIDSDYIKQNITCEGVKQLEIYCTHLTDVESTNIGQTFIKTLENINKEMNMNTNTKRALYKLKKDMLVDLFVSIKK